MQQVKRSLDLLRQRQEHHLNPLISLRYPLGGEREVLLEGWGTSGGYVRG